MYSSRFNIIIFVVLLVVAAACTSPKKIVPQPRAYPNSNIKINSPLSQKESIPESNKTESFYTLSEMTLNQDKREFRGVWIATVVNIDWPKSGNDSWEKQKADFIALLDYYEQLNFNAVIVQVRAAGDAFYSSNYAPWSRYLTGQEGSKPKTQEDPLSWMIMQTHLRGMEFHAWFNPFRATFDSKTEKLSPNHDFFNHPDWMVKYGPKFYYNPGIPEVRDHLVNIIEELVLNYDVDAVHFDDYFYPYKIEKEVFDDRLTFRKFAPKGQNIEDWRRANVNNLIQSVHHAIKTNKPWVQFGVSPFGVWRNKDKDPKGSNTKAGATNFDDLYADPLEWMRSKWIDYLIPQIYWSMDFKVASHRELVAWWAKNNFSTKIYIGNGPYKIRNNADLAWNDPNEISKQIAYSKTMSGIEGNAFFSAQSFFKKHQDAAIILKKAHYNDKILTPSFFADNNQVPSRATQIELIKTDNGLQVIFPNTIDPIYQYMLIYAGDDLQEIKNKNTSIPFQKIYLNERTLAGVVLDAKSSASKYIVISFFDRYARETIGKVFEIKR